MDSATAPSLLAITCTYFMLLILACRLLPQSAVADTVPSSAFFSTKVQGGQLNNCYSLGKDKRKAKMQTQFKTTYWHNFQDEVFKAHHQHNRYLSHSLSNPWFMQSSIGCGADGSACALHHARCHCTLSCCQHKPPATEAAQVESNSQPKTAAID